MNADKRRYESAIASCFDLAFPWLKERGDIVERVLREPFAVHLNGCGFPDTWNSLRANPSVCLRMWDDRATLMRDGREETHSGEPLALLEPVMRDYTPRMALQNSHDIDHNGPGWVVFTSYDLGFHIEPSAGKARKNGPDFPRIFAAFYPWVLVETKDRWTLRVLAKDEGSAITERDSLSERFQSLHLAPCTLHAPSSTPHSSTSRSDYDRAFASVKTAIRDGEIYQANLTQRFVAEGTTDPKSLYKRLCSVSPAPYACYLDCGDGRAIVSSSPELFYRVREGVIETRPIKGTRPVAGDAATDAKIKAELLASEKDRAELVMIVDLERNDLGRVCEPGSIKVPELFKVESFAQVHHLVATVRGKLRRGVGFVDLLRAGFPGGSITGAPKIRAMQILRELEWSCRGPYTGSVFAIGLDGSIESNILIRTILVEPERVSFNTGGGIVWDSVCDAEYEECLTKARGMFEALEE